MNYLSQVFINNTNNGSQEGVYIRVNDIFDELSEENKRLNEELLFANNCLNILNKFKSFLNKIYLKFESNIDLEDKQELNQLQEEFESLTKIKEELVFENNYENDYQSCDQINEEYDGESGEDYISSKKAILKSLIPGFKSRITNCCTEDKSIDKINSQKYGKTYQIIELINEKSISHRNDVHIKEEEDSQCFSNGLEDQISDYSEQCVDSNQWRAEERVTNYSEMETTSDTIIRDNRVFTSMKTKPQNTDKQSGVKSNHLSSDEKSFKCSDCPFATHRAINLSQHRKVKHLIKEKTFKCSFDGCSAIFKIKSELSKHELLVHKRSKCFVCEWPECGQAYKRKCLLEYHKRTHSGIRQFKCEVEGCDKAYVNKKCLDQHRNYHRMNYKCEWPECGKAFTSKSLLTFHMNRHLNVKPFKCTFNDCPNEYFNPSSLNYHINRCHKNEVTSD